MLFAHLEKLRDRRTPALLTAAGMLALSTSCSGASTNPALPPGSCASPAKESVFYSGDKSPNVKSNNQATWKLGVVATTARLPADGAFQGSELGWRSPNGQWHWSDPVEKPDAAHLLGEVGPGNVAFAVRFLAKADASFTPPECTETPAATFSQPQPIAHIESTVTPLGFPHYNK